MLPYLLYPFLIISFLSLSNYIGFYNVCINVVIGVGIGDTKRDYWVEGEYTEDADE